MNNTTHNMNKGVTREKDICNVKKIRKNLHLDFIGVSVNQQENQEAQWKNQPKDKNREFIE